MAVRIVAGYWNLDLESQELLLCTRSRQMFGIEGNSPKKLGKQDWLPRIHPDDIPLIDGELEAAGRKNENYAVRFRAVRPDGSLIEILGVGRATARDRSRFVGLNFDLAAIAATADLESRRPGGMAARPANFLTACTRPANENETPERPLRSSLPEKPSGMIKRAKEESRRQLLLERALATMEMRQLRHKFFDPAMFGEPAFDMLLALYVTQARPPIVSLRMLSPLVGVSQSSAVRWLKFLVGEGLAFSVGGDGDAGAVHATITGKGRILMGEYLKSLDKIR
jgi:hypothetical protein